MVGINCYERRPTQGLLIPFLGPQPRSRGGESPAFHPHRGSIGSLVRSNISIPLLPTERGYTQLHTCIHTYAHPYVIPPNEVGVSRKKFPPLSRQKWGDSRLPLKENDFLAPIASKQLAPLRGNRSSVSPFAKI